MSFLANHVIYLKFFFIIHTSTSLGVLVFLFLPHVVNLFCLLQKKHHFHLNLIMVDFYCKNVFSLNYILWSKSPILLTRIKFNPHMDK